MGISTHTISYLNFNVLLDHTWCVISEYKAKTMLLNTSLNFDIVGIYAVHPVILIHWGRVTHICVGNLTIIGPDNGLSPGRRQVIIWTNAGILLIGPWGTNFSEISIGIHTFSFKKIHLKMSSAKWRLFCLGLNVFKLKLAIDGWGISWRCPQMVVIGPHWW